MVEKKREISHGNHGMGGVEVGSKDPGMDSLSMRDASAEIDERDLTEGERRRSGAMSGRSE